MRCERGDLNAHERTTASKESYGIYHLKNVVLLHFFPRCFLCRSGALLVHSEVMIFDGE